MDNQTKTNKALAFTQRKIPYIPELKDICGSITASILMQQLEYWFSGHVDGFYKFLMPCEHERYIEGDSWTEELNYSKTEFKTAFGKIGVPYRSKKQFNEVVASGEDPFQGKMYASYIEVRLGLTYYIRNHEVVDNTIDVLTNNFKPKPNSCAHQEINLSGDDKSCAPEFRNYSLRSEEKPRSYNKETLEEHTRRAAAETENSGLSASCEQEPVKQIAAAVNFENNSCELEIKDFLTEQQNLYLEKAISRIAVNLDEAAFANLLEEVKHVMLSPDCFSKSGNDFFKKLNTIKKTITDGFWTTPTSLVKAKKDAIKQQVSPVKERLLKVNADKVHWQSMLDVSRNEQQTKQFQQYIENCSAEIEMLQKQLADINASNNNQNSVCV